MEGTSWVHREKKSPFHLGRGEGRPPREARALGPGLAEWEASQGQRTGASPRGWPVSPRKTIKESKTPRQDVWGTAASAGGSDERQKTQAGWAGSALPYPVTGRARSCQLEGMMEQEAGGPASSQGPAPWGAAAGCRMESTHCPEDVGSVGTVFSRGHWAVGKVQTPGGGRDRGNLAITQGHPKEHLIPWATGH